MFVPVTLWATQKNHQRHSNNKPEKFVRLPQPVFTPSESTSSLTCVQGVGGSLSSTALEGPAAQGHLTRHGLHMLGQCRSG